MVDKSIEAELYYSPHLLGVFDPIKFCLFSIAVAIILNIIIYSILTQQSNIRKKIITEYFSNYKVEFSEDDVIIISYSGEYESYPIKAVLSYISTVGSYISK